MSIFDCISLLGSLGLFLYGMRVMGDGLKKNNGSAMQKALELAQAVFAETEEKAP